MVDMTTEWYIIEGINPEPWEAPTVAVGRKGGKVYPQVFKSEKLRAFQDAIKECFEDQNGEQTMQTGDLRLHFLIWRALDSYEIGDGRRSKRHIADATNMQKSIEDALQKILFKNDNQIKDIRTTIVEQSEETQPLILINLSPCPPPDFWMIELGEEMRNDLTNQVEPPELIGDDDLF